MFYESSSSASESADENFNSVLIKKLNVNKGNAFGIKKKNISGWRNRVFKRSLRERFERKLRYLQVRRSANQTRCHQIRDTIRMFEQS